MLEKHDAQVHNISEEGIAFFRQPMMEIWFNAKEKPMRIIRQRYTVITLLSISKTARPNDSLEQEGPP